MGQTSRDTIKCLRYLFCKLEISLRSGKVNGAEISPSNATLLASALTTWGAVICDLFLDSTALSNIGDWLVQLSHIDVAVLATSLKEIGGLLRSWDPKNPKMAQTVTLRAFKRLTSNVELTGTLLYPCREQLVGFIRGNTLLLRDLLTYVDWWRSITIDIPSYATVCAEKFIGLETEMKSWSESPHDFDAVSSEIGRLRLGPLPSHYIFSNGANVGIPRNSGLVKKIEVMDDLDPFVRRYCLRHGIDVPGSSTVKFSQFMTVPKDIMKRRGISVEPASTIFYQSALAARLDNMMSRMYHPITLHDQSRNQLLAMRGSATGDYGTIDLSDASDSVSWHLVKTSFRNTDFFYDLWSLRTRYVRMDTTLHALQKFATMGSRLCFPIESLIFWAVVRSVQREKGVDNDFAIYGDDIVCHRNIFDDVILRLQRLHFVVNMTKTFRPEAPFKESCGIECYNGVDVTPIRLSRKYPGKPEYSWRSNPEYLEAYVSTINRCFLGQLRLTRLYLIAELQSKFPSIPFTQDPNMFGILTKVSDVNYHAFTHGSVRHAEGTDQYVRVLAPVGSIDRPDVDTDASVSASLYLLDHRSLVTARDNIPIVDTSPPGIYPVSRRMGVREVPNWLYQLGSGV